MPRPRIDFGEEWRGSLREKIEPYIADLLKKKPLCETELFGAALAALGGKGSHRKLAGDLRRMYSLQFRRKISEGTAGLSVLRSIREVVVAVKDALLDKTYSARYGTGFFCVGKPIQFGKDYYGRIFYAEESKELVGKKAALIILKHESLAAKLLRKLDERDYLELKGVPYQKRALDLAVGLLKAYGLAELHRVDKQELLVKSGFDPQTIKLKASSSEPAMKEGEFFRKKGFEVKENFYAGRWVLAGKGPSVVKFKFSIVAFDVRNKTLHVADVVRKRADASKLRMLKTKCDEWGLSASLHFFAPSFTGSAEKYADRWGIALHKGKDI